MTEPHPMRAIANAAFRLTATERVAIAEKIGVPFVRVNVGLPESAHVSNWIATVSNQGKMEDLAAAMGLRSPQPMLAASLSPWSERRPERSENDRGRIADECASHLPQRFSDQPMSISDQDIQAMKAAFIRRFDEDLPRTETLFAVANVGYRMALRDMLGLQSKEAAHHLQSPMKGE